MFTENYKAENSGRNNVEDSRPTKANIAVTITIAVIIGIAFGAVGMWFSYQ